MKSFVFGAKPSVNKEQSLKELFSFRFYERQHENLNRTLKYSRNSHKRNCFCKNLETGIPLLNPPNQNPKKAEMGMVFI